MKDGSFYQITLSIQKIEPTVLNPENDDHYKASWGYYDRQRTSKITSDILKAVGSSLTLGLSEKLRKEQGIL
jgi:hypothetical protein